MTPAQYVLIGVIVAAIALTLVYWAFHRSAPVVAPPEHIPAPELDPRTVEKLDKAEQYYAKKEVALEEDHTATVDKQVAELTDATAVNIDDLDATNDFLKNVGKDVRR